MSLTACSEGMGDKNRQMWYNNNKPPLKGRSVSKTGAQHEKRGGNGREMHMEIERKFTVKQVPGDLTQYPRKRIEQAYLCTRPVVRVRRSGEEFWLTYKGEGLLAREEYNFPLTEEAYLHLLQKADGLIIKKDRFCISWKGYIIELDIFDQPFAPLMIAEVEFSTKEEALNFRPPEWFDRDVTCDPAYSNSNLSKMAPHSGKGGGMVV